MYSSHKFTVYLSAVDSNTGTLTRMIKAAKFSIGQVVRHRIYPFRGVIFDVDPVFDNSDEWYEAIPENVRPHKDQPFYHLYAENEESVYEAYVSEQNLLEDEDKTPLRHPRIAVEFKRRSPGNYEAVNIQTH
ncbi:MAG: heat shock protein HspQ [Granulosicoccus sp.]